MAIVQHSIVDKRLAQESGGPSSILPYPIENLTFFLIFYMFFYYFKYLEHAHYTKYRGSLLLSHNELLNTDLHEGQSIAAIWRQHNNTKRGLIEQNMFSNAYSPEKYNMKAFV